MRPSLIRGRLLRCVPGRVVASLCCACCVWAGGAAAGQEPPDPAAVAAPSVAAPGVESSSDGPGPVAPAAQSVERGLLLGVAADDGGVRFRTSGGVMSVSARRDDAGRVVATLVGLRPAADLETSWDGEELAALDGSGLLSSITIRGDDGGSSLAMLTVEAVLSAPADFRVRVLEPREGGGEDVALLLSPLAADAADGESPAGVAGGRRVLTEADLEPVPGEASAPLPSSAAGGSAVVLETAGRVNLRPEPTLDSVPLLTLPDATPLRAVSDAEVDGWRRVALGGLEGWVSSRLVVARAPTTLPDGPADVRPPATAEEWLGEPGAWLERLGAAATAAGEAPRSPLQTLPEELLSPEEVDLRTRALRESTSRRMELADRDLREARADAASMRIDLARNQRALEEAEARIAELEALVDGLRRETVVARSALETSQAERRALEDRLTSADGEITELRSTNARLADELLQARTDAELARVRTEALRRALDRETVARLGSGTSARGETAEVERAATPSGADGPTVDDAPVWWAEVEAAIEAWARSWTEQRVDDLLAAYAGDFEPVGMDAASWRRRLLALVVEPSWVEVGVEGLELRTVTAEDGEPGAAAVVGEDATMPAPALVRATFLQSYRAPDLQDLVRREQVWRLEEDGWRILEEAATALLSVQPPG